ncbi:putative uncharacterized protein [Eubacterium sp. CAG:274]|nr:putative uncharacterized protein [Eubacterium sp. CAG:274]
MNENENINNNTTDDVCDSIPEDAKDVNLNEEKFSFSSLPQPSTGTAIASLVLGILSVLCCCSNVPALIMAVAGIVLGVYSYKKDPLSRTTPILGIVLSGIGLVLALIVCLGLGAASLIGALGSHIYY